MAKHYDAAVVNFAGIKYPLKIYSGGKTRQPVWSHGIDTRECGEQVAEHYDTAVVNFAGMKYPLKR